MFQRDLNIIFVYNKYIQTTVKAIAKHNMRQSELFFLPAAHGDAFIIHCFKGANEGFIIVDGGPYVNKLRNPFLSEVEKLTKIDLLILTHQDDDHLIGIKEYIKKHQYDKPFPVETLWVNSASLVEIAKGGNLSANHANKMADILREIEKTSSIRWKECVCQGFATNDIQFADIKIVSPTKEVLEIFLKEYEKKTKIEEHTIINLAANRRYDDFNLSLDNLTKRKKNYPTLHSCNYNELANMTSIAFILECEGLKLLMLGDSFPQIVEEYLRSEGYSSKNKLQVDYVKVSHHGSRNNTSNSLLDMIDCHNYLISTNGGTLSTYHPDRETFANILCHVERKREETIHLFFNHKIDKITERVGPLFRKEEQEIYNFKIHQPNDEWPITLKYSQP